MVTNICMYLTYYVHLVGKKEMIAYKNVGCRKPQNKHLRVTSVVNCTPLHQRERVLLRGRYS